MNGATQLSQQNQDSASLAAHASYLAVRCKDTDRKFPPPGDCRADSCAVGPAAVTGSGFRPVTSPPLLSSVSETPGLSSAHAGELSNGGWCGALQVAQRQAPLQGEGLGKLGRGLPICMCRLLSTLDSSARLRKPLTCTLLDQEAADLVDRRCAARDEPGASPVQHLLVELIPGLL